jgi:hypothetical protein
MDEILLSIDPLFGTTVSQRLGVLGDCSVAGNLTAAGLELKASANNTNATLTVMTDSENHDAILYLGTPFRAYDPGLKCALIAEGLSSGGRSKFHVCLASNGTVGEAFTATLADSKLSVEYSGKVTIPGSLVVGTTDVATAIAGLLARVEALEAAAAS